MPTVATSIADELWVLIGEFLSARDLVALVRASPRFSVQGGGVDGAGTESIAAAVPRDLPPLSKAARQQIIRLSGPDISWRTELLARGSSDPRSWLRLLWEVEGAVGDGRRRNAPPREREEPARDESATPRRASERAPRDAREGGDTRAARPGAGATETTRGENGAHLSRESRKGHCTEREHQRVKAGRTS